MRSIPIFFFFALLAPLFMAGPAQSQQTLNIVAVVNEEVISALDLGRRLSLVITTSGLRNTSEVRRRMAKQVLQNLISDKLKLQEAKRLSIRVTREEIQRALADIERQRNLPSGGLDEILKRAGIRKSALVEQLEATIAWGKVIGRTMRAQADVTDQEISESLAELRRNEGKQELRVFEIFVPLDTPQSEGQSLLLADRLVKQLKAGADFPSLARSFSQNPSAEFGGDLGWISPGQLDSRLDTALATMEPGDVSSEIRTLTGYYILKLAARRSSRRLGSEQMTLNIQQVFFNLPPNPGRDEVKRRFDQGEKMTERSTSCLDLARIGQETGSRLSGNLGTISLNSLPENMRKVVRDLEIGIASRPIRAGNGLVVLMVCNRQGDSTGASERDRIESMLIRNRLGEAARRRLRNLRRQAFLDIRL